jgi:hypothetical protein
MMQSCTNSSPPASLFDPKDYAKCKVAGSPRLLLLLWDHTHKPGGSKAQGFSEGSTSGEQNTGIPSQIPRIMIREGAKEHRSHNNFESEFKSLQVVFFLKKLAPTIDQWLFLFHSSISFQKKKTFANVRSTAPAHQTP